MSIKPAYRDERERIILNDIKNHFDKTAKQEREHYEKTVKQERGHFDKTAKQERERYEKNTAPLYSYMKILASAYNTLSTNCMSQIVGALNEIRGQMNLDAVKVSPPKIEEAPKQSSETSD